MIDETEIIRLKPSDESGWLRFCVMLNLAAGGRYNYLPEGTRRPNTTMGK
jgi:hypothetical protein